jgi:hypothetical protein
LHYRAFFFFFFSSSFFFFCSCYSHLELKASVKLSASLQLLNLRESVGLLGREISPSQGRYLIQTQNKRRHPCLEWDSNPRYHCSRGRRYFMPQIARLLWPALQILVKVILQNS